MPARRQPDNPTMERKSKQSRSTLGSLTIAPCNTQGTRCPLLVCVLVWLLCSSIVRPLSPGGPQPHSHTWQLIPAHPRSLLLPLSCFSHSKNHVNHVNNVKNVNHLIIHYGKHLKKLSESNK